MNRATRRAFDQTVGVLIETYEQTGPFPDQEAIPLLLADEVRKCLEIGKQIDVAEEPAPPEEIDELGTHALECLSDLGLWAWQLKLDEIRAEIENIAFDIAQWLVGHGGVVSVLEPVVNSITRKANATRDPATLSALFDSTSAVIVGAKLGSAEITDPAGLQPWLALHFNYAIIATRTLNPERINAACDLLEERLPGHCAAFYEEGLREAGKKANGETVREIFDARLAKWTHRD